MSARARHAKSSKGVAKAGVRRARRKPSANKLVAAQAAYKEALEQQRASAEILKVISDSPTDVQPVFETIARTAMRLCATYDVGIQLVEGQHFRRAVHIGPLGTQAESIPMDRTSIMGRVAIEGRTIHIEDLAELDEAEFPLARSFAQRWGLRTVLCVPLLRGDRAIGVINLRRRERQPFTDRQIALIEGFARQAVIAIENVRLFNETKEALEQQTATADILRVISSSPKDVQRVFEVLLDRALGLCDASHGSLFLLEGNRLRRMSARGVGASTPVGGTIPLETGPGRAVRERRTIHLRDVQQELSWHAPEVAESLRRTGIRTVLSAPLLREQIPIGAILIRRTEVRPFSERHVRLLETFADQAVIAIENVRLFNETKEALEHQTAISEVLEKISGSPTDVSPVLAAVAERAARLCEGEQATVLMLEEGDILRPRFTYSTDKGPLPNPQTLVKLDRGYVTGRAALDSVAINVEDVAALTDTEYPAGKENQQKLGYRSFLAAPMMREGKAIGVIAVWRRFVRRFSDKHVALVKTFADQAAIAIENVRLFNETKEALERQTATADILKVISSSHADLRPVFDVVLHNATRLCDAHLGILNLYDGEKFGTGAQCGANPEFAKWLFERDAWAPAPNSSVARMVEERRPIQVRDMREDLAYLQGAPVTVKMVELGGARTFLTVPLLRDGKVLGNIGIYRPEVREFTDRQISLVRTFADQAVIAIENVRLFNETKEALEQQTATAEVLKLISRTTFELEKVLQTLLDNAARLSGAVRAAMLRPDADGHYMPAVTFNYDPDGPLMRRMRERPIRPGRDSINGRALLEKRPIHVPDVLADPEYGRQDLTDIARYRTVLSVPMLRNGEAIGLIALVKGEEVDPFTDKQMEVITTFADQAVIAIENVRLFREIEEKSRQLEVANKHKSEFLANMSHELRTPLNAIIGFSEVLIDRMFGEVNEKQADYLKDIHESGRHLLSLINDILDLSKIEAGRMELEVSAFDLPSAISNAMTLVRERAQRHGIVLGAEIDSGLGEFRADERKFKQIMLNLLSNAVKFTPDGGRVDVRAKRDTTTVEIAVRDTGVGIAPEDQAALFEEFKQLGRDVMRKAEGTGLGLALTKKFVELHGGAIRVESAPGKGSTFSFSLPLAAAGRSASSG